MFYLINYGNAFMITEFLLNNRKFIYDFELMSLEQCLTAETYFRLHDKMLKTLPATPSELEIASQQMSNKYGYACLFVEFDDNGQQVPFNPVTFATLPLSEIRGNEARQKLEDCKLDFFLKSGLAKTNSIDLLLSLIPAIKELPNELRFVLYRQILNSVSESISQIFGKNSSIARPSANG
jgi:hypothetical protein